MLGIAAGWALLGGLALAGAAHAQPPSPLGRVEALGLESAQVGRVEVYFAPGDRERALEMAALSGAASEFFERELGVSFDLSVAALSPDDWFSEFPGIPYAIPWPSMREGLILMPSSLEEGLLIQGRDPLEDRRTVDFVLLHEIGHLAAKAYFRPVSESDYLPVKWFEELLANCFAVAFVRAHDLEWATADEQKWRVVVDGFTPPVVSLDWSFMNDLPPAELARTYAWYQNLLNLRAAELHDEHGLGFLRSLRSGLDWQTSEGWTTESLLPSLEAVAPGFGAWAADPLHATNPEDAADPNEAAAAGFEAAKQLKDRLYAEKTDCPRLMSLFSEDVAFWEKGRRMSYEFLVEYCPKLPKDIWQPVESESQRDMLGEDAAYEILSEKLVDPEDGSTYRRTTTEVWEKIDGDWKIVHMNIGLHPIDEAGPP